MPSLKELMAKANLTSLEYTKLVLARYQHDMAKAVKAAIKQSAYYQGVVDHYLEATKVDPLKVDSDDPMRMPGQMLWTFPALPKFGGYFIGLDIANASADEIAELEAAHKLAKEGEQKAKDNLAKTVQELSTVKGEMVKRPVWPSEQLPFSRPVPAPDYTHPLTGWRVWGVIGGKWDYRLCSISGYERWAVKQAEPALCRDGAHPWPAPEYHCYCGYYALSGIKDVIELLDDHNITVKPLVESNFCFGEVSLWGRVIECDKGWRAEYAYPKRLCVFNPEHAILSDIYGVPVTVMPKGADHHDNV